jgi:hypothetical protein
MTTMYAEFPNIAKSSRPSGQWSDEEYDVLADGQVVGRVYEQDSAGRHAAGAPVVLVNHCHRAAREGVTHGHAATLEEAASLPAITSSCTPSTCWGSTARTCGASRWRSARPPWPACYAAADTASA